MSSKTDPKKCLIVILAFIVSAGGKANADFTFGTPTNLGPTVNSSAWDGGPSISTDGLTLFFDSFRPGGTGGQDLWVMTRETTDDKWGEPVNLGPNVNSSAHEWAPTISADGLSLYFGVGWNLWITTRETRDDAWGTPVNLGPIVNSSDDDVAPSISSDGLSLFFIDYPNTRPGGYGGPDLWVTRRATTNDPWSTPMNLGSTVNSASRDDAPEISTDGFTLYFLSNRPGGSGDMDLWQASIEPVVDLNADGIVDAEDMCIIVDYWGMDEPLCDIGPMPWGDGIVDVQDLIVLAEHLFEEIPPVE